MTDTAPHADQQLRDRIAQAFKHVDAHQWGYHHEFYGRYGVDPETDSFVDAALAEVQPKLDRLRAQLAGVWPCTCGHLPDRHRHDPAIGRNFCRGCRPDADLHDYDPAPSV